jgi:hypothetical protein
LRDAVAVDEEFLGDAKRGVDDCGNLWRIGDCRGTNRRLGWLGWGSHFFTGLQD